MLRNLNPFPDLGGPGKWEKSNKCQEEHDKLLRIWLNDYVRPGLRFRFKGSDEMFIRKVYGLAASDAHGDFNYTTDNLHNAVESVSRISPQPVPPDFDPLKDKTDSTQTSAEEYGAGSFSDNAWFIVRTQVFIEPKREHGRRWKRADDLDDEYFKAAGQDAGPGSDSSLPHLERMRHGVAILTDGPLPWFVLDAQTQFDSERFAFDDRKETFDTIDDEFFNIDGRIGGWGKFDGQLTALLPQRYYTGHLTAVPGDPAWRLRKRTGREHYVLYGWENSEDFGGTPAALEFLAVDRQGLKRWRTGYRKGSKVTASATVRGRHELGFHPYYGVPVAQGSGPSPYFGVSTFGPQAFVLTAAATEDGHFGVTNPLYVAPVMVDGRKIELQLGARPNTNPPVIEKASIPPEGLVMRWSFSISMDKTSLNDLGIGIKQLDAAGRALADAEETDVKWKIAWDDDPAVGASSLLTISNASEIEIDTDQIYHPSFVRDPDVQGYGTVAYSFVVYLKRPRDVHGNRLNPIAHVVTAVAKPNRRDECPSGKPGWEDLRKLGAWGTWSGTVRYYASEIVTSKRDGSTLEKSYQSSSDSIVLRSAAYFFERVSGGSNPRLEREPFSLLRSIDFGGRGTMHIRGFRDTREGREEVNESGELHLGGHLNAEEGFLDGVGNYSFRLEVPDWYGTFIPSFVVNTPPDLGPALSPESIRDMVGKLCEDGGLAKTISKEQEFENRDYRTKQRAGVSWNFNFEGPSEPPEHVEVVERAFEKARNISPAWGAYVGRIRQLAWTAVKWTAGDPKTNELTSLLRRFDSVDTGGIYRAWSDIAYLSERLRELWVAWKDEEYQAKLAEMKDAEKRLEQARRRASEGLAAATDNLAEWVRQFDEDTADRLDDMAKALRDEEEGVARFAPRPLANGDEEQGEEKGLGSAG